MLVALFGDGSGLDILPKYQMPKTARTATTAAAIQAPLLEFLSRSDVLYLPGSLVMVVSCLLFSSVKSHNLNATRCIDRCLNLTAIVGPHSLRSLAQSPLV